MDVKTFFPGYSTMTSAPFLTRVTWLSRGARLGSIAALLTAIAASLWTTLAQAAPTTCAEADTTVGCCDGNVNYFCNTQTSTTVSSTTCSGSEVCGWDTTKGYYACVASPGGADPSGKHPLACGGSSGTSGTSSGGGGACGDTIGDATCNACIVADCCSEAQACTNDQFCPACITSNPPCATDPAATTLLACIDSRCASACGVATGATTSSGSSTGSGGSANMTFALVGNGACNASPVGATGEGLAGMACLGTLALAAVAARRDRRRSR